MYFFGDSSTATESDGKGHLIPMKPLTTNSEKNHMALLDLVRKLPVIKQIGELYTENRILRDHLYAPTTST